MHSSTSKYTYKTETRLSFQRHSLIKVTSGENQLCDQKSSNLRTLHTKRNNISHSSDTSLVLAEASTASSENVSIPEWEKKNSEYNLLNMYVEVAK